MKYLLSVLALAGVLFGTTPALAKTVSKTSPRSKASMHLSHRTSKTGRSKAVSTKVAKSSRRSSGKKTAINKNSSFNNLTKAGTLKKKTISKRASKKTKAILGAMPSPQNQAGVTYAPVAKVKKSSTTKHRKSAASSRKTAKRKKVAKAKRSKTSQAMQPQDYNLNSITDNASVSSLPDNIFSLPTDGEQADDNNAQAAAKQASTGRQPFSITLPMGFAKPWE